MKPIFRCLLASLTVLLPACASQERVIHETVGPAPQRPAESRSKGYLEATSTPSTPSGDSSEGNLKIYTARRKQDIDKRLVGYAANSRWDRVFFKAHTDYALIASDGKVYRKVQNSRGTNDGEPAVVTIPAGTYQVKAEAEDFGADTFPITISVRVEPGQTTTIFLSQEWEWTVPKTQENTGVQLPNGRIIGWRAAMNH